LGFYPKVAAFLFLGGIGLIILQQLGVLLLAILFATLFTYHNSRKANKGRNS